MSKELSLEEMLANREHCITMLDEYVKLIEIIGGEDETMVRSMFLGHCAETVEADRVTHYAYDPEKKELHPTSTMIYEDNKLKPYDYYSDTKDVSIPAGEDVCGYACLTKEPILVNNVKEEKRYKGVIDKIVGCQPRSLIAIPMIIDGQVASLIEVANGPDNRSLTEIDIAALSLQARITFMTLEKAKLFHWSVTDNLTKLFNYQYLQTSIERELIRAQRYPADLGVILVDVDNFKEVNDTYGHAFGNEVLKGVADAISKSIRKHVDMPGRSPGGSEFFKEQLDIPVRYGGDEFLLLLPETNLAGTEVVANRLLKNIRSRKFKHEDGKHVKVTLSIGATAAAKDEAADKDLLIKRADEALYKAKDQGRDGIVVIPPES